ncbi:DUF1801 domain-containing protein [Flavobacterium sp.]|uniref:iron chaperone n=1 Tax=Flavobacterium sp. TaxID=239 RepID=UPI002622B408|nr:DUF1801 domain-containing protein [Flavobacterium sp.]
MNTDFKTIDDYIKLQSEKNVLILEKIRQLIRTIAPNAEEKISYGIPTFKLHGNLVHFAAYKNHIGFYPGASGVEHFKSELSKYNTSKGTIQFQLDEEIPYDLIKKITEFRIKENIEKSNNKKK